MINKKGKERIKRKRPIGIDPMQTKEHKYMVGPSLRREREFGSDFRSPSPLRDIADQILRSKTQLESCRDSSLSPRPHLQWQEEAMVPVPEPKD